MAAAINVRSLLGSDNCAASSRPRWRAVTMSGSEAITTHASSSMVLAPIGPAIQVGEPLLQVQGGRDVLQPQAQLHHLKGNLGLNTDDHGLGTAQPDHLRDRAQRA